MRKILIPFALFFLSYGAFAQPVASTQLNRNLDYTDLLEKSLIFYDAQACGPNVASYSSFDWRGACHTDDGQSIIGENKTYNLTGGWHDAGDHVKFNYPMAYTIYYLASLYVDHKEQIDDSGSKDLLLKHLRFIGDYMIKCHPEPNKYVIQIATGQRDHTQTPWQVPEANTYERRVYFADEGQPNTNLACANAAGFAALSMAFRGVDNSYSAELLQHARDLYDFGYQYQRSYNDNTELPSYEFRLYQDFNNFQDEIMIGAAWLYRATQGEQRYRNEFDAALAAKGSLGGWAPGWGDHHYEATYQMAKATGAANYRTAVGSYLLGILNGSEGSFSPGGMWYVGASESGFNLPSSLGAANLAYRYADLVGSNNSNYQRIREFAFRQVNYTLGDNPRGGSYVIDFGNNFPRITHHRSASAGNKDAAQDPRILTGALVMGPLGDDVYLNDRNQIKCTEPALGNNAALALAATLMVKETGGSTPPPPSTGNVTVRARGVVGSEQIEIRYKNQRVGSPITLSTSFQEYKVQVNNANGNFKVAFVNDNGSRDAEIDWLQVGTTKRQAETRSTNTAVWQNGSCGGSNSQRMNCNGIIDFGTMSDVTSGKIVIRAKGQQGNERMRLEVNGQLVKTWNGVATAPANYSYDGYSGGTIKVLFDNDGGAGSTDRNLAINYLDVCGARQEAEGATTGDGYCGVTDGGFVWLWCNGSLSFGNVGCNSSARTISNSKVIASPNAAGWNQQSLRTYPNPATDQLTVAGGDDYQVTLYDLSGRSVMQHDHLTGKAELDIRHLRPGVYLLKLRDSEQHELRQRVVIE